VNAASHMHADRLAGLGFDVFQKVNRVGLEERHVRIGVESMKSASGVPGRAGGQDRTLHQRHVAPPKFRQMVKNRGPDDPPANDDGSIVGFQLAGPMSTATASASEAFGAGLDVIVQMTAAWLILSGSVAFVALSRAGEYAYA
jgi:hypothetical protein